MSLGALLIRADASVAIGTGHVMRCLALAQAWQDAGGRVVFVMAQHTIAIKNRLRREAIDVILLQVAPGSQEDSSQTAAIAADLAVDWVVVDGYQFDSTYQS